MLFILFLLTCYNFICIAKKAFELSFRRWYLHGSKFSLESSPCSIYIFQNLSNARMTKNYENKFKEPRDHKAIKPNPSTSKENQEKIIRFLQRGKFNFLSINKSWFQIYFVYDKITSTAAEWICKQRLTML